MKVPVRNAMTVDVEDYIQVQAFAGCIDRATWHGIAPRVEANVDCILDQFASASVSATFFTLGWIAERHKPMVRRIVAAGHELASHGFWRIALAGDGPLSLCDAVPVGDVALVLGSEGDGIRRLVRERCEAAAFIPISRAMESLNVSNAAAIAFYEASRRNGAAPNGPRAVARGAEPGETD